MRVLLRVSRQMLILEPGGSVAEEATLVLEFGYEVLEGRRDSEQTQLEH